MSLTFKPTKFWPATLGGGTIGWAVRRLGRFARAKDRGSVAVFIAVGTVALIGFGAVAIDTAYYGYRNLLLRQTVQAAALAGANNIKTYYSSNGQTTTITSVANSLASANMPAVNYGTVLSSVTVGNWNSATKTFTSLASSGGTHPDAVQVVGADITPLFFGSMFGRPTANLGATVVASALAGVAFNTIVINDMSQSFSTELAAILSVDQSILNCVKGAGNANSQFGITLMNGHSTTYQGLTTATAHATSLLATIVALTAGSCGSNCGTGSNVAASIYSAIQQFSSGSFAGTSKNIVIVTDGVPNADNGVNYQTADGIYPTPSSATPTCSGVNHCTDANLMTMAQNQAAVAKAAGISISTIYYSGDTPPGQQASYATKLASLVGGSGVALVAPTSSALSAAFAGFCSTIPSSLRTVM